MNNTDLENIEEEIKRLQAKRGQLIIEQIRKTSPAQARRKLKELAKSEKEKTSPAQARRKLKELEKAKKIITEIEETTPGYVRHKLNKVAKAENKKLDGKGKKYINESKIRNVVKDLTDSEQLTEINISLNKEGTVMTSDAFAGKYKASPFKIKQVMKLYEKNREEFARQVSKLAGIEIQADSSIIKKMDPVMFAAIKYGKNINHKLKKGIRMDILRRYLDLYKDEDKENKFNVRYDIKDLLKGRNIFQKIIGNTFSVRKIKTIIDKALVAKQKIKAEVNFKHSRSKTFAKINQKGESREEQFRKDMIFKEPYRNESGTKEGLKVVAFNGNVER